MTGRVDAFLVSLALAGANGASYLLTVAAARLLAPETFGELSTLLAILVIGVVPAMALQTVVALRTAAPHDRASTPGVLTAVTARLCLITTVLGAVAAVPLSQALHLRTATSIGWVVTALLPLTTLGLFHGLLQGTHRFRTLAVLVALEGAGKVGATLLGLIVWRTSSGALFGTALGSTLVAATGWFLCGRPRPTTVIPGPTADVAHAVPAVSGLVLLVNLDLILARHVLPSADVGVYAVGAVVTKIAYWLPQAVGVIVLPRLADSTRRRRALRTATIICLALNLPVIAATALAGPLGTRIIGGPAYTDAPLPLWMFALVGTLLAVTQLLLFARIADRDRVATVVMWTAVVTESILVLTLLRQSATQVVTAALITVTTLALAGFALEHHRRPRPGAADPIPDQLTSGGPF